MDKFLNIPLEAITSSNKNTFHWEGVIGDFKFSILAKRIDILKINYIVYVDLCGYPEKWWLSNTFKIAEAAGDNIKILEIEIKRQLNRLNINL